MKLSKEFSALEIQIFGLDPSLSLFKALTYSCRDMNEYDVEKAFHEMLNTLDQINSSIRLEFDKKSDIEEKAKLGVPKENLHPPANQEVVGSRPIIRPTLILCN